MKIINDNRSKDEMISSFNTQMEAVLLGRDCEGEHSRERIQSELNDLKAKYEQLEQKYASEKRKTAEDKQRYELQIQQLNNRISSMNPATKVVVQPLVASGNGEILDRSMCAIDAKEKAFLKEIMGYKKF